MITVEDYLLVREYEIAERYLTAYREYHRLFCRAELHMGKPLNKYERCLYERMRPIMKAWRQATLNRLIKERGSQSDTYLESLECDERTMVYFD